MSQEIWETAQDLVAKLAEAELREIIHEYGEERWAKRIAQAIVRQRRVRPIRSTRELAQVIEKAIASRRGRIHPATRTFQALRIAVNDELANLRAFLGEAEGFLRPGGRLCVISFHSLEDRIVKEYYRRWGRGGEGVSPSFRILTPKGIAPSRPEILQNPRARSARLRAAEKLPV